MLNRLKRRLGCIKRRSNDYNEDQEGAAAIEFAILAIPFFTLVFGVIELAIILFINASLDHAVSEAGRQIRIGNFQACSGNMATKFRTMVCDEMGGGATCEKRLRVDVKTNPTFKAISLPPESDPSNPSVDVPNGVVDSTVGGDPVVARAIYYYPLALPSALTRLETVKGSNQRKLFSTTAFRNEPFSAPGACPS